MGGMRRLWLLAPALAIGCASAPIKKADLTALARADARVLEGCYDCLLEARAIYERVGVAKARPLVIARLFETQLLVTLREKELALDSAASLARAREFGKELPPEAEAERYLALVDLVPADNIGTPRREASAKWRAHAAVVPTINDELAWLKSASALREPARQYLSLAVDCAFLSRVRRPPVPTAAAADLWSGSSRARDVPAETVPLVAYRAGMCDAVSPPTLTRVREAVPAFVETAFFLGRLELADAPNTGGRKVRDLLADVYRRFPQSPSVTYLSANFNQLIGNYRDALRYYDETLAIKSLHEDALLGRTMCLSHLKRTDEAIATASHMIDLRTDNWGEAYYWRAWNYHFREQLEPARADIERAKALEASEAISTLAGIIEHDQNDLAPAESDLVRAKTLNRLGRACTAMWYLGLVKMKQEKWLDSGHSFDDAMACYAANVKDEEDALAVMQARTDLEADFRAGQIASFEAALKEDRAQQYAAAFNAANHYTRAGNVDRAKVLIEVAAKDPALAELVAQLRGILKGSLPFAKSA
jgi:tetratricopeptide (TPR) repeat protein